MKKIYAILLVTVTLFIISCKTEQKDAGVTIPFEKYTLGNGLTVILNEDKSDPIVAVALLYHVGSSRETEGRTGFAHLFEHMMFGKSENVPAGDFDRLIIGSGGENNGGTGPDNTVYFEVIPKNALEVVLWLESDRLGFLENTVTKTEFANQQNVVQNEKRQSVDNAPYGHEEELILKTLYPKEHPYSWDVIGKMEDLTNATVEDVKAFHRKFYTPKNATLVISGDIKNEEVKELVKKYFDEIPGGEPVEKRQPMNVSLSSTLKLYHEDIFAKAPRYTMVFPVPEQFSKDAYALDYLADLLSNGKKTPLYKVLVKDKKITSSARAMNMPQELTGMFRISVTANPGVDLKEVEKGIFEAFAMFEKDGFTEDDLARIKAKNETNFYSNFSSILMKSFTLGQYQMFRDDPEFYETDFNNAQAVTMTDIKRVYEQYIKGKNYVATSFVPKGETGLIAENSVNAGIAEEDVTKAAEVKAEAEQEEPVAKTPTNFDRTIQPPFGPDPEVSLPSVWTGKLANGISIYGITQTELPLVNYSLIIEGGHQLDELSKAGLANLTASVMNEGTKNKTPEELEDAIKLLGASISVSASNGSVTFRVSTLARNFEKTLGIVEEMLFEPRWDQEQYDLAKLRIVNNLKRNQANPSYLASTTLNKLVYGQDNILATELSGKIESVESLTIDDLKTFYEKYFSPTVSKIVVAGDINLERVEKAFSSISEKWQPKTLEIPQLKMPEPPASSQIYFVDIPGAKQSVIYIGRPSVTRTNPDYYPITVANYKLGGNFNSIFNMILREEKGFTYGAHSYLNSGKNWGSFMAFSMVRTNATLESLTIFKTEMEKYRKEMPQEYIDFTKSALLKGNALNFETLWNLVDMLNNIAIYELPVDYIKREEAYVKGLTIEKQLEIVNKYFDPSKMYYVVVGDAKTQLKELEKAGLGKPVLYKN